MIRRPPRSTQSRSSAASDVYKRQHIIASSFQENLLYLTATEIITTHQGNTIRSCERSDPEFPWFCSGYVMSAFARETKDMGETRPLVSSPCTSPRIH